MAAANRVAASLPIKPAVTVLEVTRRRIRVTPVRRSPDKVKRPIAAVTNNNLPTRPARVGRTPATAANLRSRPVGSNSSPTALCRNHHKARWIRTIRPLRDELRLMRDNGQITPAVYRKYYLKAKGGLYRSRGHLRSQMRSDGVLKKDVKKGGEGPAT